MPSETVYAVAGFVLTSLIGIVGYFVRDLHHRFERHLEIAAEESKQIAELRVQTTGTRDRIDDLCERLERIDTKLDRLIERGRPS